MVLWTDRRLSGSYSRGRLTWKSIMQTPPTRSWSSWCIPVEIGKVIKNAGKLDEMWMLLETHFDEQTNRIDGLLSQFLMTEWVESEVKILWQGFEIILAEWQMGENPGLTHPQPGGGAADGFALEEGFRI
jgi:hypothetical protein